MGSFCLLVAAVLLELVSSLDQAQSQEHRDRIHIVEALIRETTKNYDSQVNQTLSELYRIYEKSIKPMEEAYKFRDLGDDVIAESDILSKPLVLFVGPWSTGKSTMINYLIGINETGQVLHTGAEPTTSEFTVVSYGEKAKTVEGLVLATDKSRGLSPLERFGQGFLERLEGKELPYELLKRVTLVDTPGIIENRKQQERGYPFNAVMRWFILRADLIFVVFDPSKLDVGFELEALFEQLKGRESQIRLILNKADQVSFQELMRVYGALFWSLAPLINVTEPPRVYVGSFWDRPFKTDQNLKLFIDEEMSLLNDLRQVIENQVENKIGFVRQHATQVKIHSLLVDRYLRTFRKENSLLADSAAVAMDIIANPEKYRIFQSVISDAKVSKYDLPSPERYMDFFSLNSLVHFKTLEQYCQWLQGCDYDHLEEAISLEIPKLLVSFRQNLQKCQDGDCH